MGSIKINGIRFSAYSDDHEPRHLHAQLAETKVILDFFHGGLALANRRDAVKPDPAKASHVKRILATADAHAIELIHLWDEVNRGRK